MATIERAVFEKVPQVVEKSLPKANFSSSVRDIQKVRQLGEIFKPLHSATVQTGIFPLNIFAQYCLEGYNQPIAITAYEGVQILPKNFNETLPSFEELEAEVIGKK